MKNAALILFLAFPVAAALACGPTELPGPGMPLFDWSMAGDPLYLDIVSSDFLSNGNLYETADTEERTMAEFSSEWAAFLDLPPGEATAKAVRGMLESDDPYGAYRALDLKPRAGKSARSVKTYFALLLQSQALDAASDPYASPAGEAPTPALYGALAEKALAAIPGMEEGFLKRRAALVALKALALSAEPSRARSVYRDWFASLPNGAIRARALGWLAKATLSQGKRIEAMRIYVDLFDQFPSSGVSQISSLLEMNPSIREWDDLVAQLPHGHKRAMATFVRALLDPHRITSRYMAAMFAEEGGSVHIPKLLIRSLREVDWQALPSLWSSAALGPTALKPKPENAIPQEKLDDLISFCEGAIASGGFYDPGLLYAAEAHLLMCEGQFDRARAVLEAAVAAQAGFRAPGRCETAFHRWLCAAATGDPRRPELFAQAMAALEERRSTNWKDSFTEAGYSYLAEYCLDRGSISGAVLAWRAADAGYLASDIIDIYATVDDLKGMLEAALEAPAAGGQATAAPPRDEAGFLLSRHHADPDELRYVIATRLMRERRYGEAAEVYGKVSEAYWKKAADTEMDLFAETGKGGLVRYSEGNTVTASAPMLTVSRKALAQRLAALEKAGKWEMIGWIYLSTPYVAYNDMLWHESGWGLVYGANDWALSSWPCVSQRNRDRMLERKKVFLEQYDSNAIGADYLMRAAKASPNREVQAVLAVAATWAYSNRTYTSTLGTPSLRGEKKDEVLAYMKKNLLGTEYLKEYARGCPGLAELR